MGKTNIDVLMSLRFKSFEILLHPLDRLRTGLHPRLRSLRTVVMCRYSQKEYLRNEVACAIHLLLIECVCRFLICIDLRLVRDVHARCTTEVVDVNLLDLAKSCIHKGLAELIESVRNVDHETVAGDCSVVHTHGALLVILVYAQGKPVQHASSGSSSRAYDGICYLKQILLVGSKRHANSLLSVRYETAVTGLRRREVVACHLLLHGRQPVEGSQQ